MACSLSSTKVLKIVAATGSTINTGSMFFEREKEGKIGYRVLFLSVRGCCLPTNCCLLNICAKRHQAFCFWNLSEEDVSLVK